MGLELRVETFSEEHIEPYVRLSRVEYGDHAAVSQANHLRWKFIENPQGLSIGINLYDAGELVGRMVALPRKFLFQGKTFTAAHIVDFLVHPQNRGMESLLQLVTGLKKLSGFDLQLIMAPNPAGAAVWEKFVKMPGHFDLDVAMVPLRPAAILQSSGKLQSGKFGQLLEWPWRFLMRTANSTGAALNRIKVESKWPDPAELDQLHNLNSEDRVVGLRSAAYIEWRYRQSPVFQYNVSFLRDKGALCGYFVTRRTVYNGFDCLFVVDAFGRPELTAGEWRAASSRQVAQASADGAEMAMILGNTGCGSLAAASGMPFLTVPQRFLPRKTTVYAQWISSPGFPIRRDNFCVALGDSDVI